MGSKKSKLTAGSMAEEVSKTSGSAHGGQMRHLLEEMVGLGDMVLLDPVTEKAFVENLRIRLAAKEIYTYIGNVVISVNPYKKLSIYTPQMVDQYRGGNMFELPPHVYAIANDAFRSMRDKNQDQCIIISGESGSGKTEASKIVMQYVAAVSGKGKDVDRVKEQLLQSNPVLEAFGNAKTVRNDNSSRFGKYMDIEFNFKADPVGGIITNYLLEKSRVVFQAPGERNFHIFYQLLAGAPDDLLDDLKLSREHDEYHYLNQSGCVDASTVNDKKTFQEVTKAMDVIGFSQDEISQALKLVAAVLHLGNIELKRVSLESNTEGCRVVSKTDVSNVCELLGGSENGLCQAITWRKVETKMERVRTALSHEKGLYARDALAKAVYDRLFSWLVQRINDSIRVRRKMKCKVIGVLDIYGFEIFQTNSFEQFVINYCNEKLQQVFIELTLHEEQAEYIREGIEWEQVDYFDNSIICDLIEKPNKGILALLDDDCIRPGNPTDESFLGKLNQQCIEHPHFESRASKNLLGSHTLSRDSFRLFHYAGKVDYCVKGFLDKNKDLLFRDLSQAMFACDNPLLKKFFPEGDPENASKKRPPTAGFQFRASIGELMKNLMSKHPNYIRCIKPNDMKRSLTFDKELVLHQVRYLGLMENLKVRRAGYAYRQFYEVVLERYKMLATKTWPVWKGDARDGLRELMKELKKRPSEYAFGRTKIFIRNPRTVFDLEDQRRAKLDDIAVLIQKMIRGWLQKTRYQKIRNAEITISRYWKGYKQYTRYNLMRDAAIIVAAYCRGWLARREYRAIQYEIKVQWAVGVIAKFYYGWKVRKEFRLKFRARAGPVVYSFLKRVISTRFLLRLRQNLPSMSPLSQDWPQCNPLFKDASTQLKLIYHRWRCQVYRKPFLSDAVRKVQFVEKLQASQTFKGKKSSYSESVAVPFKGDYVGLNRDEAWNQLSTSLNDRQVIWADLVNKINRADGKAREKMLVITKLSFLVLDPKTMKPFYRVPLSDLQKVSVSQLSDDFFIFHVAGKPTDHALRKGDYIFQNHHVIELVTKTARTVSQVNNRSLPVMVANRVEANLMSKVVEIEFGSSPRPIPRPICRRKGPRLEVSV